uniref:Uncharacterized protein n=1 Tax=Pelusios castaneus TaxID=367368 RepID=A0A8C8RSD2_9SAUR
TIYYYNAMDTCLVKRASRILHSEPDVIKGDTLIDTGSGPTIHQLLSTCESFKEIIATVYTYQNLWELEKRLKNEPGGNRYRGAEKEARLRKTVKQVLKCDVHKSNPLDPVVLPPADCLVSSLCLEAACKDLNIYRVALKNISSLLKPEEHLVLSGDLGCSFYIVGPQKFSCLVQRREVLSETGFFIQEPEVLFRDDTIVNDCSDFSGMYFNIAYKEKEM